ncbi:MAG: carboxypeptidase M32 [Solobacterium sp.]|nr:carboxypeptidase M32 [Solobacterium sp.]
MIAKEKIEKYKDWIFRMSAYNMALSVIGIDKLTVAPAGGNAYRDERSAFLAGELFTISTDPQMAEILKEMKDDTDIDPDDRRAAQLYYKEMTNRMCIPKDEFVAYNQLQNRSYDAWLEAKTKNDYSIFAPYLQQIIEGAKKIYGYRNSSEDLYDLMLDDFEPGMTREKYDVFFDAVRNQIIPLIRKVTEAEQIDDSFLYQDFPVDRQKQFTDELLPFLHFDKDWGYQNETEHPFTGWICENDVRTTTKYLKNNVMSAIFSTVHEVGHATYEHDIDDRYDGMILSEGVSSGMHESQSRLFENYLGRTDAFWEVNYPVLRSYFPEQFEGITKEAFMKAVNVSRPSLVRTEADELTYPVHILIRYELEKALFSGELPTEGLDKVWDDMYEKYLGVRAEKASRGILQDVHWANGNFGYFPTYALGSAFSAQFMHKMREDIDVDRALSEGHMEICIEWLKENIHKYGCRYDADEIMRMATGEPFNVQYYVDYLTDKYSKLYGLE